MLKADAPSYPHVNPQSPPFLSFWAENLYFCIYIIECYTAGIEMKNHA